MAQIVSIGAASRNPNENKFRADFKALRITLNGNRVSTDELVRVVASTNVPGYIDQIKYDMSGQPVMASAKCPDHIRVHGQVAVQGAQKAPCGLCYRIRNKLSLKKWWTQ
jgi:hypothetical protein